MLLEVEIVVNIPHMTSDLASTIHNHAWSGSLGMHKLGFLSSEDGSPRT